ncbi:MAG: UbiA-like polyprenyltransferase [Geobacteraceae bacterium]|nr:UbiA-like polyprenyltransferase [Geobacteraceae bacterium]
MAADIEKSGADMECAVVRGAPVPGSVNRFGAFPAFLETIKFSHTVFALPFALTGALLAARGIPETVPLLWIVAAMVGARTMAMGLNRLIDADIDAANPRTRSRAIPAGKLGKGTVAACVCISAALFLTAAHQLNSLCFRLAPAVLFVLAFYSYCKRFTAMSHLVLGFCLAGAPVGAWIAIRGSLEPTPLILGLAVLLWVAGFDILYALQDLEFDRASGLHSIPARLGVRGSLWIARLFHLAALALLAWLSVPAQLGSVYLFGVAVAGALMAYEHWIVRNGDLARLDAAFFTMNGYVSMVVFVFTLMELARR